MMPYQNYNFPSQHSLNYPPISNYIALDLTALEELNNQISLLVSREGQLMNEVLNMRSQLQKMKTQMAETISQSVSRELDEYMEKVKKTWQQKTYFKKDKICGVEGCNRRYSSRIALRAHMKRKHRSAEFQTEEFHP